MGSAGIDKHKMGITIYEVFGILSTTDYILCFQGHAFVEVYIRACEGNMRSCLLETETLRLICKMYGIACWCLYPGCCLVIETDTTTTAHS